MGIPRCNAIARSIRFGTACPFDVGLMGRCAELGVDRFVMDPPEIGDLAGLQRFLEDYAELGRRIGRGSQ